MKSSKSGTVDGDEKKKRRPKKKAKPQQEDETKVEVEEELDPNAPPPEIVTKPLMPAQNELQKLLGFPGK